MHLQVYLQIPGLVFRYIFWLCVSVGFAAVGRKGGLTWLEFPCTPNKPCLSPWSPSGFRSPATARPVPWLCVGLWCMAFVGGEALSSPLVPLSWCCTCSPGTPLLDPVLGQAGVCAFPVFVREGLGMLIPQGSRNIHSVTVNLLCAIFCWNHSLHWGRHSFSLAEWLPDSWGWTSYVSTAILWG